MWTIKIRLVAILLIVIVSSNSNAHSSRIERAIAEIYVLVSALELFKKDVGRFPSTEEGLQALLYTSSVANAAPSGYLKRISKDPWGREYEYRNPGLRNKTSFDLWSYGADGLAGGNGFDTDVGNWPDSIEKLRADASAARNERILKALPVTSLIGILFSGTIYLGVSLLRNSGGVQRRKSFHGKSIWIGCLFFLIYWIIALPLVV